MGKIRQQHQRISWTEYEKSTLEKMYPTATISELLAALPGRTFRIMGCKAHAMKLRRPKTIPRTPDEIAIVKRERMAETRRRNPERVKEIAARCYLKNKESRNSRAKAFRELHFFWHRANKLDSVTAKDLARIWKRQRGRCALSGRRLDRTAEVDHILPRARGGTDALDNLQWLTRSVNRAKLEMLQDDFIAMCREIAERS